jgi:hypothetical protein
MGKNKLPQPFRQNQVFVVRSSAAEYLTFVAAGGQSETSVEMRYEDKNCCGRMKIDQAVNTRSAATISRDARARDATSSIFKDLRAAGSISNLVGRWGMVLYGVKLA